MTERANALAKEILDFVRDTLIVHLRFMNRALCQFELKESEVPGLSTDGQSIFYQVKCLLMKYKEEQEAITRTYLHMVLHCIFRHMFIGKNVEQALWDLSCDVAVENCIRELSLPCTTTQKQQEQSLLLQQLKEKIKPLTAEKLYRYFQENPLDSETFALWQQRFRKDYHDPWYASDGKGGRGAASAALEEQWREIGQRVQTELESHSYSWGKQAQSMLQELTALNRERYDYRAFLERFMTLGEVMKTNDGEFDSIFYTYGLSLYGNLPLIEPLEYQEQRGIRDFVIAIDTSGSTSGELVQTFLQKTYNIMRQQDNFFPKFNLHIIQCDDEIREDAVITCQEDFDAYLQTMKIIGQGGTDLRPVFEYVAKLQEQKVFSDLRGLIYFTDGFGDFPEKPPPYETAFVFLDKAYNNYAVPLWAIKLILSKEEIEEVE